MDTVQALDLSFDIVDRIRPLMGGCPREVQGTVIAQLLAMWVPLPEWRGDHGGGSAAPHHAGADVDPHPDRHSQAAAIVKRSFRPCGVRPAGLPRAPHTSPGSGRCIAADTSRWRSGRPDNDTSGGCSIGGCRAGSLSCDRV